MRASDARQSLLRQWQRICTNIGVCAILLLASSSSSSSSVHALSAGALQTRTSTLIPWTDSSQTIGWVREERNTDTKTYSVSVAWDDEPAISVKLPFMAAESLGSTLWPSAFAGAILGQSPVMQQFVKGKHIMELGAGLGLTGWVLAESAASCHLTDNDQAIVDLLQQWLIDDEKEGKAEKVSASFLEWRDSQEVEAYNKAGLIFGTDIAYYYFLLRPIMDTIQAFKCNDSPICIIGQANRESQWDLYHNIKDGCYNQLTDEREEPWPGTTKMLLYKLQMQDWHDEDGEIVASTDSSTSGGVIPIAALINEVEGNEVLPMTPYDYIATDAEENESY